MDSTDRTTKAHIHSYPFSQLKRIFFWRTFFVVTLSVDFVFSGRLRLGNLRAPVQKWQPFETGRNYCHRRQVSFYSTSLSPLSQLLHSSTRLVDNSFYSLSMRNYYEPLDSQISLVLIGITLSRHANNTSIQINPYVRNACIPLRNNPLLLFRTYILRETAA